MVEIVTPEEMRRIEQGSGISEPDLMRRAGGQIARWITEQDMLPFGKPYVVLALVGPGNNGGDALVAVSELQNVDSRTHWDLRALFVGRPELGDLPIDADALADVTIVDSLGSLEDVLVVIDGVYGTGGRVDLPADVSSLLQEVNARCFERQITRVAVDVPTGVDGLTGESHPDAFQADYTLSLGFPKAGLFREPAADRVGELVVLDIGLSSGAGSAAPQLLDQPTILPWLPKRAAFAHKGSVGSVLIVGGAPNYIGAPRLAAEAAMRVGAGLVGLAVPRSIIGPIASQLPEAVYLPLTDSDGRRSAKAVRDELSSEESRYTTLVLGPGLGRDGAATDLLRSLFQAHKSAVQQFGSPIFGIPEPVTPKTDDLPETLAYPLVLDADALHWLAGVEDWPTLLPPGGAVLTPHAGEMAKLAGISIEAVTAEPWDIARKSAAEWGQVVVLKAGYTCVADPNGSLWIAPRVTPELATAGTGDVLAGMIGGFLAQGLGPAQAACCAVYLGAKAGGQAANNLSVLGVTARDLIDHLVDQLRLLTQPQWYRSDE
jgi:NAD(P)H-hydrate epimerase